MRQFAYERTEILRRKDTDLKWNTESEYLKTKNKKILSEIADFSNDPLFNGCKKMDNFKNKFNELEKKLNGNEEELYW